MNPGNIPGNLFFPDEGSPVSVKGSQATRTGATTSVSRELLVRLSGLDPCRRNYVPEPVGSHLYPVFRNRWMTFGVLAHLNLPVIRKEAGTRTRI